MFIYPSYTCSTLGHCLYYRNPDPRTKPAGPRKPRSSSNSTHTRAQPDRTLIDVYNTHADTHAPVHSPVAPESLPTAASYPPTPPPRTPTPPLILPTPPATQESDIVAQVCEVIPDVSTTYVRDLAERYKASYPDHNDIAGLVLHSLFEVPTYPKDVKGKGKEKHKVPSGNQGMSSSAGEQVDYRKIDRERKGGLAYGQLALVS